jgi:hypothetical protein
MSSFPCAVTKGDVETFDLGHRLLDGFWHVEKLDVGEDLFVAFAEPTDEVEKIAGHEHFQPHFVKGDGIAQFIDELFGEIAAGDIQRDDEPFFSGN